MPFETGEGSPRRADAERAAYRERLRQCLSDPAFRAIEGFPIAQLGRNYQAITPAMVKARLAADFGQLGSLGKAIERVMFSLRNWGLLADSGRRYAYTPRRQALTASGVNLESWMLACALHAHPSEEMPFADLLRLPELFPFRFSLTVDQLRQNRHFSVQRQGMGWDMVRVETPLS